jgi:hypothetical protein
VPECTPGRWTSGQVGAHRPQHADLGWGFVLGAAVQSVHPFFQRRIDILCQCAQARWKMRLSCRRSHRRAAA